DRHDAGMAGQLGELFERGKIMHARLRGGGGDTNHFLALHGFRWAEKVKAVRNQVSRRSQVSGPHAAPRLFFCKHSRAAVPSLPVNKMKEIYSRRREPDALAGEDPCGKLRASSLPA